MHISLRADEKFYINGAVLRVDRKVSIEIMNEATFLLEAHVMSAAEATTPLRQLYFIVQMMLMDPSDTDTAMGLFEKSMIVMLEAYHDPKIITGLRSVKSMVAAARYFDALKTIRGILPHEAATAAIRAA